MRNETISLVDQALRQANDGVSKLNSDVRHLQGYSGVKVRHLLNNLAAQFTPYVEVGCYLGSTLIAAAYGNSGLIVGVDNFTDETRPGEYMVGTRRTFLNNLSRYSDIARPSLIDASCWDLKGFFSGVKCCFFDGAHTYEDHVRSVTELGDWFADDVVFVVDDFNRQNVREATDAGIRRSKFVVQLSMRFGADKTDDGEGWWNGIGVYLLSRSGSF